MEYCRRPQRFDIDPDHTTAAEQWTHWILAFKNLETLKAEHSLNRHDKADNELSSSVYRIISDAPSYEEAIHLLHTIYVKPKNDILTRHLLTTWK